MSYNYNNLSNNRTSFLKDEYIDPLLENRNYSGNDLDIPNKWYGSEHKPPRFFLEHRNDNIKHNGYDYRGKILKRSLSPVLYLELKRKLILEKMETVVTFMVEHIKHIKGL
jgi:hypothetical protein